MWPLVLIYGEYLYISFIIISYLKSPAGGGVLFPKGQF